MAIVMDGNIGNEIAQIANKLSEEYTVSLEQVGMLIQFEYSQHLKIDDLEAENMTKIQALENVANELLEYSLIHGPGKYSSMSLPVDPKRNGPKYKFRCEYVIFSK